MSAILAFEAVSTTGYASGRGGAAEGIDFVLSRGEICLVHADHDSEDIPFLELSLGMLTPASGRVLFDGQDWTSMRYKVQLQQRGRIGGLAREQVWLANQTVLRNVLLGLRHHTTRPEDELEADADALARQVGLGGVPRARPDGVAPRHLRMAGWVRSFLGEPALLVLLYPGAEALSGWPEMLDGLLREALKRGAAILVVSDQSLMWKLPVMASAAHYGWPDGVWSRLRVD